MGTFKLPLHTLLVSFSKVVNLKTITLSANYCTKDLLSTSCMSVISLDVRNRGKNKTGKILLAVIYIRVEEINNKPVSTEILSNCFKFQNS